MLNEPSVNVDMDNSRNQTAMKDELNEESKDQSTNHVMAVDEGEHHHTTTSHSVSPEPVPDTKYKSVPKNMQTRNQAAKRSHTLNNGN